MEAGEYRPHKKVLCSVLEIGKKFRFSPTDEELELLSIAVKYWPPFHDSGEALRALQTKNNLIVLLTVWVKRRKGMEGTGATPAAYIYPVDIEVQDLKPMVS